MATKKRKGLPKKEKKKTSILFDFLNDIMVEKKNILNDENKHAYSRYMITRFLSMHERYIPIVDAVLNKYQGVLTDEQFHQMCISLIPKKKVYLRYVKGAPLLNECKEDLKYIMNYFNVSQNEAFEYYQLIGDELIVNIKMMMGIIE